MVEHRPKRTQAGLDIPEAFPIRELGDARGEELIPAGETPHAMLTLVALDDLTDRGGRHEVQKLRKDGSTTMHAIVSEKVAVKNVHKVM